MSETSHATRHATGTFQVKIDPQPASSIATAADVGRMTLDKTWSGDITGSSKGEMLTGITAATGAMAYVAMERMDVTIYGQSGTFLLSHTAVMQKQDPASGTLDIRIVPNSGTGSLAGMTGTLQITITGGVHHYDLTYALPESAVQR